VGKLNVDEHPTVAQRYGITGIPALVFFHDGQVLETVVGAVPQRVLAAHVDEVERILARGGAAGKRLDFLAQELNREANTLASKAATQRIADSALELKLLIEQIREQVQNIE